MSFSGHQPYNPTAEAETRDLIVIANDGFFPGLDQGDFIRVERITDEYRSETITHALVLGIDAANTAIAGTLFDAGWMDEWTVLVEVPATELGGQHLLTLWYTDAVYAWAKCHLMGEYATMNRKKEAENVGKETAERCPVLMARFRLALAKLSSYDPYSKRATSSDGFSAVLL